jgi:[acyl-carrier-protein] S-malonyltransferase
MPKIGLLFPGQGSQFVGMGKELIEAYPSARAIYTAADQALGLPLSRFMLEGPEEELKGTDVAQPAILTATVAAWTVLREKWNPLAGQCLAAGHSLGEYSALVASGSVDFDSAVKLVRQRGELMLTASRKATGGMAAVIGLESGEVAALCQEAAPDGVQVANLNCPGQVVISGSAEGLERFSALAKERKIRVMPLAVSGPFHSRFMAEAGQQISRTLESTPFQNQNFPVVANFSARPVTDPTAVRSSLVSQVSGAVRWEESMRFMLEQGVSLMVEIGPGKVLRGLMKKIAPEVKTLGAFTPAEIEETAAELNKTI